MKKHIQNFKHFNAYLTKIYSIFYINFHNKSLKYVYFIYINHILAQIRLKYCFSSFIKFMV